MTHPIRSHHLGELVVSKQISLSGLPRDEVNKVENEVRVLSRLSHEHIVAYLCSFQRAGNLCIVMEYADGGSLADALASQAARAQPFSTATVSRWVGQLSSALEHVHSHRVLHRDIKPENIFLSESSLTDRHGPLARNVKLGDFGVSRMMSTAAPLADTVLGTPYYLSPELVWGKPYGEPSDVWALGVVLFQLLTMQRPFDAPNLAALVMRIANTQCDVAALERCEHPLELRRLASPDAMLHPDMAKRCTLQSLRAKLASFPDAAAAISDVTAHAISPPHAADDPEAFPSAQFVYAPQTYRVNYYDGVLGEE